MIDHYKKYLRRIVVAALLAGIGLTGAEAARLAFERTGQITASASSLGELGIDGVPCRLAKGALIHNSSGTTLTATTSDLQTGKRVGYTSVDGEQGPVVTEIWILP